ncbi:Bacterial alpha-L-rhamnosidase [Penicillium concentricum]|uniref:alpha-L-rhamnosidase n=1 Tax=Penicillium concentricum TaxID=293559 RepID=A0A9W9SQQ7_9EURO|nr:Bacterial alpha-L-rhamnosidase [Penicillium concentricum]KAJ5382094.1 Bacterial alpha-L-rhamnosidase [Penicillium concentricum]
MPGITDIRFEHHHPRDIGIGESCPRISWSYTGEDRDWVQEFYTIEVSRHGVTKSYSIRSSQCLFVPWPSAPLSSMEVSLIRVRASDDEGNLTEWSDIATVEVGLLHREDWKCQLIHADHVERPEYNHRPIVFKREFSLQQHIRRARLYITAHGIYSAKLNGKPISDHVLSPGWTDYNNRLVYQTSDITSLLEFDHNMLHVTVAPGWHCGRLGWGSGKTNIYSSDLGVIALLRVDYENGDISMLGTDRKWQWGYGPTISAELYDGEVFDASQSLSPLTQWGSVDCKPIGDRLEAPDGPPIKRTQEVHPIAILTSPSGQRIIDMGQNMVGWLRIKVIGGATGHRIQLQFAEALEDGECALRTLRNAKARDTVIMTEQGTLEWEPEFTYHGFRYVGVDGWPGVLTIDSVKGIVVHTDMKRTGSFSCSNPLLNKLHENIVWSMRGNFVGIPTDCPQRDERLGWTGDINVFADAGNFLYRIGGTLKTWLDDLKYEQQEAKGIVPLVIPNVIDGFDQDAHAIWGDVAVMLPWSLYRATGDTQMLARQYSSMKAWLDVIPRRENQLWDYISDWKLGDWLDPAAPADDCGKATTNPSFVSDAFLAHVTTLMKNISEILKEPQDAQKYSKDSEEIHSAFAHEYITPAGLVANSTQTAFALAIQFNLLPSEKQQSHAAQYLSKIIREVYRYKIGTGFAGTPYIGHALSKVGLSDIFYRMLLCRKNPSWLYPVTMGATTVWERWDSMLPDGSINSGDMTSFNHYALGSVASWMHSVILGFRIEEAGWKKIKIEPIPGGGLRWASGEYLSGFGLYRVRWLVVEGPEKQHERLWVEVQVPPNTSADVKLPNSEEWNHIGSGSYSWTVPFQSTQWPPDPMVLPFGQQEAFPVDESLPCPWDMKV